MLQIEIVSNDRNDSMFAERGPSLWLIKKAADTEEQWRKRQDTATAEMFLAFLEAGYDRFVLHLEDTILISPSPGKIVCVDTVTGAVANADWALEQVQAVCALALGGDEWPEPLVFQYYEIAEKAIAGWPAACRPIP